MAFDTKQKPCYATDYTHARCKYSVNRGWTEDTKFYVPTATLESETRAERDRLVDELYRYKLQCERWEAKIEMLHIELDELHQIIRELGIVVKQ